LGGPGYGENTFIGLDVHAVNVVGCALDPATGELMRTTMAADPAAGLDWIRRFEAPVKAVYESGPTGYALTRFLSKTGIDCLVTASPMLLLAPGRQSQDGQAGRHCAGRHARSLGTVPRSGWRALPKKDLRDLSPLRATAAKDLAPFDSPVLQLTYEADLEQAELLALQRNRIDQRVAVAKSTPMIDRQCPAT
jgi:transposase